MEKVRDEDVELGQIGFRSRAFKNGIFSPTDNGVVQIHDMVREVLGVKE